MHDHSLKTGERGILSRSLALEQHEGMENYAFAVPFVARRRVLDLGCGTGYGALFLARSGAHSVLAIDNSIEAVQHGSRESGTTDKKSLNFGIMSAGLLALRGQSWDAVTAFEVLEHLSNPDNFLAEVVRVLKSEGVLVLSTPNWNPRSRISSFHEKEYTRAEIESLIQGYFHEARILGKFPATDKASRHLRGYESKVRYKLTAVLSQSPWVRRLARRVPFPARQLLSGGRNLHEHSELSPSDYTFREIGAQAPSNFMIVARLPRPQAVRDSTK